MPHYRYRLIFVPYKYLLRTKCILNTNMYNILLIKVFYLEADASNVVPLSSKERLPKVFVILKFREQLYVLKGCICDQYN